MRNLLARGAVPCAFLAFLVSLAGCSMDPTPPPVVYKDSRSVTTRPARANGRNADVLVRVCELQTAGGAATVSPGDAPPADAKKVASTELLATYGTPFYCTLGLPNERFELGGTVTHQGNATCRVHIDSMHHVPGGGIGVSSTQEMPLGQTRTLMGGGAAGRMITVVLEPLAAK